MFLRSIDGLGRPRLTDDRDCQWEARATCAGGDACLREAQLARLGGVL